MDFALSEEQEELRRTARELLAHECPPERVRKILETRAGHDPELDRRLAAQGWTGILVPEAQGGAGLTLLDAAVLLWELGRAVVPGPFLVSSIGAAVLLREGGSRAQREAWLPRLASGEMIATLAVAELPEPRFDAAGVATVAARDGRGWRLDGRKVFVDFAHVAELVLAAFRVGRRRGGAPAVFAVPAGRGLRVEPLVSLDETRRPCELSFRRVRLAADARLGGATERGTRALARALDACAVGTAASSLGAAERALERAVEYVKTREQFGRPVGSFQAVQHMAAEAVARLEPARSLLWYAAWAFDARPREAPLAGAMAKAHASDVARAVTRAAVEMHGGIAFTWEHDLQLSYKRALADAFAFGDADWHRERVAALSF